MSIPEELEAFNILIEQAPEHSEQSEDGSYLLVPIAYLEPDLRFVYKGAVQVTIQSQTEMFGAVCMCIRLKVFHPYYKEWFEYDGTAAIIIESEQPGEYKGSTKTLVANDIKTGVAQCYSEALKNAAKKIGPRFGSDLNRTRKPGRQSKEDVAEKKTKVIDKRYLNLIEACETIAELNKVIPDLPSTPEIQKALNLKLTSLKKTNKKT